jgi:DNA-binding response OmpR family regulator
VGTYEMNASQTVGRKEIQSQDGEPPTTDCAGRLLIVDDEPDICEFLAEELTDHGYECVTANSVDEALERARIFEPQAIISDVRMPFKSGVDLLQSISMSEKPVPVLLISGFTDVSLQQIYRLGAVALLPKPLNIELLMSQIQASIAISSITFGSRSSNRSPTEFPAQISLKTSETASTNSTQAVVCNLSRSGIYIQVSSELLPQVGQKVSFAFHDPKTSLGVVRGSGICRWTHQVPKNDAGKSSCYGFGLEFQDIESDSYQPLLAYVSIAGSFWSPDAIGNKRSDI